MTTSGLGRNRFRDDDNKGLPIGGPLFVRSHRSPPESAHIAAAQANLQRPDERPESALCRRRHNADCADLRVVPTSSRIPLRDKDSGALEVGTIQLSRSLTPDTWSAVIARLAIAVIDNAIEVNS